MKHLCVAGASALALAVPAHANEPGGLAFNGTFTLGYSSASDVLGTTAPPGVDLDAFYIGLSSDVIFSPRFELGFDVEAIMGEASSGGTTANVDVIRLGVEPRVNIANGIYAGAYYHMHDIDLSIAPLPITFGVDLESYGIFGGYDNGTWYAEAWYGMSDTDPGLPAGVDLTDYGIRGGYGISPSFDLFGSYAVTDIDTTGGDAEFSIFSIGGEYGFDHGLSVYGTASLLNLSLPGPTDPEATQIALGVTFDLQSVGSSQPVILSAEVAHNDFSAGAISDDHVSFAVGVTVPIGGGSSSPLNASTRTARGDYRVPVSSTLFGLF